MHEAIKQRREAMKLTQNEAAKRAKVSLNTWQRAEAGHGVRASTLQRISAVIRLPLDDGPKSTRNPSRRHTELENLETRYNKMYPTPDHNVGLEESAEDYPALSPLVAFRLATEAGMFVDLDPEEPLWFDSLPFWVKLHVSGNAVWIDAMNGEFDRLHASLDSGSGLPQLTTNARIAALYLAADFAAETVKDMHDPSTSKLDGDPEDLDAFMDYVFDIAPSDRILEALRYQNMAPRFSSLYGEAAHLHPFAWFEPLR